MTRDYSKTVDDIIEKFSRSDSERLLGFATKQLISLLPGGKFYNSLKADFVDNKDIEEALTLLASTMQEISREKVSKEEARKLEFSILRYIETFESVFLQKLDVSNKIHKETLEVLNMLLPPAGVSTPTLFVVSGPSAAGKDSLIQCVMHSLRARGYEVGTLKKYTNRTPRKGERSSDENYYDYVTDDKFDKLVRSGEIILEYSKYNNRYGFSAWALKQSKLNPLAMFCIISDFPRVHSTVSHLRADKFRVFPVLIYAPAEDCRRRMPFRNLSASEVKRRIREAEADCVFINESRPKTERMFNAIIENGDDIPFNEASKSLYQFVETSLLADKKLDTG